jgi:type IV pilus assembly protein PilM
MGPLQRLALWRSGLLGLDIGTTSIKAARIRRRGDRVLVTGTAWTRIEPASADRPATDEQIAGAISQCLWGFRRRQGLVCGLSGADVAVRTFEFPPLPRHQLGSAVELEAAQVCPFEVGEAAVAYHVLRGLPRGRSKLANGERIVGFFAAARNAIIRRRRALCEQAQATCTLIDVDGLALLNCLEACGLRQATEAALVLNVRHSCTNLAIISEDGLPFVRDIGYGGDHILARMSEILTLPRPAVIAALRGQEGSQVSPATLGPVIRQTCADLADRVGETLRYYSTRQSGPAVDRVFLCGGFAEIGPIAKALTSLLPGEVKLWDPLAVLPCTRSVRKSRVAEHGPAMAVALGLALRTLRDVHD